MNEKPGMSRKALVVSAVAALILFAIGFGVVALVDNDEPEPDPNAKVTIKVDGADGDRFRDEAITAPQKLVDEVERSKVAGHEGARDETPPKLTDGQIEAQREFKAYQRELMPPLPTAGATQNFPGCRTVFVRNRSSRNGIRPQLIVDHYTVSANRSGLADMNAVTSLGNSSSASVSWHFLIDREGHCYYSVPLEAKAWTGAAMNPHAVQIEIINTGREQPFMGTKGYAKLAAVHREIGRRTGIPMRRGSIRNCTPQRSGIIQHFDGGYCAGGHTDVKPFSLAYIIKISQRGVKAASRYAVLSKTERRAVSLTCYHRGKRNKLRRGTAAWKVQNGHVADWRRTVKRNYVKLHSPWNRYNRGKRRSLQVAVYVNKRGSCKP